MFSICFFWNKFTWSMVHFVLNQTYFSNKILLWIGSILWIVWHFVNDKAMEFLPYQLLVVRSCLAMVLTGNGELGFDSGEGAWEMATTSKEGSRRVNYPIPTGFRMWRGSDNKSQGKTFVFLLKWLNGK